MKILFLGENAPGQTSFMRMRAFERLGNVVCGVHTGKPWKQASWLSRRVERYVQRGPVIDALNRSIIETARNFKPDLIWGEKQEFLRVDTIGELHSLGGKFVHFTPDPYFSLDWKRTRLQDAALKAYDIHVYCKSYERESYRALGKPLIYMPLGFCDEVHRPLPSDDPRWSCAVGFLGGWEPRRESMLHAIASANINLKIWGGYWEFLRDGRWTPRRHIILRQLAGGENFAFHHDEILTRAVQGDEVYADDYARALTGSKIGIGFLRHVCPDQHTTRTFEIPACGSMLLADRTDEHREFFEEGEEAEFFGSTEELLDKVQFYGADESARARIARAGYERCFKSEYSYVSRLKAVLKEIS